MTEMGYYVDFDPSRPKLVIGFKIGRLLHAYKYEGRPRGMSSFRGYYSVSGRREHRYWCYTRDMFRIPNHHALANLDDRDRTVRFKVLSFGSRTHHLWFDIRNANDQGLEYGRLDRTVQLLGRTGNYYEYIGGVRRVPGTDSNWHHYWGRMSRDSSRYSAAE